MIHNIVQFFRDLTLDMVLDIMSVMIVLTSVFALALFLIVLSVTKYGVFLSFLIVAPFLLSLYRCIERSL